MPLKVARAGILKFSSPFEPVGIAPSAQTPLILLMNRSCKFAIFPYFFGIYVNIIRPTKCTAFCSHLPKKRRIAQSPPVVILEIRRAVEDSDGTVFKRHPDMPIVNRLSLYDLMQNIHANTPYSNSWLVWQPFSFSLNADVATRPWRTPRLACRRSRAVMRPGVWKISCPASRRFCRPSTER